MTKIAATPIYDKNLKNLLQNQKSYDLETWHAASGAQALQSLFKWLGWPSPILRQGQMGSPIYLNGENCYIAIKWGKLAAKS